MTGSRSNYFLIFSFLFYLFAQAFQQYVLLVGPLASVSGIEESIVAGQHSLNSIRHYLIYASMFLMVPAFIIVCMRFYPKHQILSIVALVFFLLFCSLEIGYRSVHIFQVLKVWGAEFVATNDDDRGALLEKFQYFYQVVNAIYFPLLTSLLIGSACICILSYKEKEWLLFSAMAISCIQQVSRLSGYTSFHFLDIFSGIWYFVLVLFTFGLLTIWAVRDTFDKTERHER